MRMSYFIDNQTKAIYAAHRKLKGYWYVRHITHEWLHINLGSDGISYHDHFNNPLWDYSPITIRDARCLYPNIKAFKYIEPQAQEAGTQPAIQ